MEKTRKAAKQTEPPVSADTITSAYITQLLTSGTRPASVYKFCLDLGIREDEFYSFFGSFEGVEKSIWNGFITRTINRLQADAAFSQFSAREKILSFYFTLLEELRRNRSFVLLQLEHVQRLEMTPAFLKDFRKS